MNRRVLSQGSLILCLIGAALGSACGTPSTGNDAGSNNNGFQEPDGGQGNNNNDAGPGADAGPGGDAGPASSTYCDGFAAENSSSDSVNVQTFAFEDTLKTESCSSTINAYTDGTSLTTLTGVFDLDTSDNGAGSPAPAIFVTNCGDLGLPGFTAPTATSITPPSGAMTVAAAYATTSTSVTVYGVVTAVYAWGTDPDTTPPAATAGTIYIQDPASGTPAAKSGTEIYFGKANEATYGTPPTVGEVVAVSGLKWSPYQGVNQFEATAGTTVTSLGTSPLPAPVSITAAQAGMSSYVTSSGYEGMRVSVTGGPFTVHGSKASNTCPTQLEYTDTGD